MFRLPRRLALIGGAAAIGAGAFAFMAGNNVRPSNVGEGSAAVSGYTVYNIDYSGVPAVGNPTGAVGTMQYTGTPIDSNGISEQDGVTTVSFQLSPDNAHWAAVQLYGPGKGVIGGGGASNCTENLTTHVWTCTVTNSSGGPVPASQIYWIDVEAAE